MRLEKVPRLKNPEVKTFVAVILVVPQRPSTLLIRLWQQSLVMVLALKVAVTVVMACVLQPMSQHRVRTRRMIMSDRSTRTSDSCPTTDLLLAKNSFC